MLQVFGGLLVGAMLPFWFSAMTMKSVGKAALAMVEEVRRQFNTINGLMEGTARPDYSRCVQISTDSSLREMIPPGKEHVFFSESTALDSLAGY
jgi:inorganic pyrophosphatase